MTTSLKNEFLLNPAIRYLNHGSFGACPKPVFAEYQRWQLELERNPIDFFTRQLKGLFTRETGGPLEVARSQLSEFVGADPIGMIFTPNVTIALNILAHSIPLAEGDEVLTTNHEYNTILETWKQKCEKTDAILRQVDISLPLGTQADFVDHFWTEVTANTKVILLSHITSATALVLPIKEICRRARKAGIITIVDGAHAVGQLDLDLIDLDADFYTSNCHKWLLTPKGTAFLYVHPDQRESLEPMVISWAEIFEPSFALRHEMWGTRDMAGFLSIPAALEFRKNHDWDQVARTSREIVYHYRKEFAALIGIDVICDESWLAQMAAVLLPTDADSLKLWRFLWDEHMLEAMITQWQDKPILRLGFNGYNDSSDMDELFEAVRSFFKL
ncbi:aminotransferase class V-fold PLP-dependent enzyme [bacterium]|nr:aminotransferase class V-fold PLP-dependent enzyme [bacterium]